MNANDLLNGYKRNKENERNGVTAKSLLESVGVDTSNDRNDRHIENKNDVSEVKNTSTYSSPATNRQQNNSTNIYVNNNKLQDTNSILDAYNSKHNTNPAATRLNALNSAVNPFQMDDSKRISSVNRAVSTANKLNAVAIENNGRRITNVPAQQTDSQKALINDSLYSATNPFSHMNANLRTAAQNVATQDKQPQNTVDWDMERKLTNNSEAVMNKLTGNDGSSIKQKNQQRATDYIDYLNNNYEGAQDYLNEYNDSLNVAEKTLINAGKSYTNLYNSTQPKNNRIDSPMAEANVTKTLQDQYHMSESEARYWASNYGTLKGILDNKEAEETRNAYIKNYSSDIITAMNDYVKAKRDMKFEPKNTVVTKTQAHLSYLEAKKKLEEMGINPKDKGEYQLLYEYMDANYGAEENEQIQSYISNLVEKYPATTVALNLYDVGMSPVSGLMATAGTIFNDATKLDKTQPSDTNSAWYMPQNISTAIQNATNEEIERTADKFNVSPDVGKFAYGVGSSTAKSLYSMALGGNIGQIASTLGASSNATRVIMQLATLPSFGGTAYASTLQEQLDKGLGQEQAQAYAIVAGINEMLYEELSLDKAWGIYTANAAGKVSWQKTIMNMLAQAGIEGSEEVFTELSNRFADAIINTDFSQHNINVRQYMEMGYTQAQAEEIVKQEELKQLLETFFAGAISGGITGVVTTVAGASKYKSTAQNIKSDATKTQALYDKTKANAIEGTTARDIVDSKTAEELTENDISNILESLAESGKSNEEFLTEVFIEAGETEESAQELAKQAVLATESNLGAMSEEKASKIEDNTAKAYENDNFTRVMQDYSSGKIQNPSTIAQVAMQVAKNENNAARAEKISNTIDSIKNKVNTIADKVSGRSDAFAVGTTKTGQVGVMSFDDVSQNKAIVNTNKGKMDITKIDLGRSNEAMVLKTAADYENTKAANILMNDYTGQDIQAYISLSRLAYNLGQNGQPFATLLNDKSVFVQNSLEELKDGNKYNEHLLSMYKAGLDTRSERSVEKVNAEKAKAVQNKLDVAKDDKLYDFKSVIRDYTQANVLTDYAETRFNAAWITDTATLKTSANATNEYAAIVHEMFEFSRAMAPKEYEALKQAVLELAHDKLGYAEVQNAIKQYQNAYRTAGIKSEAKKTLSEATDEFVNDFMSGAFSTESGAQQFIEHVANNDKYSANEKASIFQSFADWVNHLLDTIKEFLTGKQQPGAKKALELEKMGVSLENIRDMALKAMDAAKVELNSQLATEMNNIVKEDIKENSVDIPEGTKFSLNTPIEQTDKLIALHNLSEDKLISTLELGGFAMPSIAVTKADMLHDNFGTISVLFYKSVVQPNQVYSGDAYTPMFPRIDYKIDRDAMYDLREEIKKNVNVPENFKNDVLRVAGRIENDAENYGVNYAIERLMNDTAMMQYYLGLSGKAVETQTKTTVKEMTDAQVDTAKRIVKAIPDIGSEEHIAGYDIIFKYGDAVRNVWKQIFLDDKVAESEADAEELANGLTKLEIMRYLRQAKSYANNGKTETIVEEDYAGTQQAIRDAVNKEEYREWLQDKLKNIVEKSGIRNNKDTFTPSGNRRSFEQLHSEVTLENIVKSMLSEKEKGGAALFSANSIFGASTRAFKSIDEMKKEMNRLQKLSDEDIKAQRKEFLSRLEDIAERMLHPDMTLSGAMDAINDAVAVSKTKAALVREMNKNKEWYIVDDDIINDVWELVGDIAKMPTTYFEAKPRRAVGFDEIKQVIIPNNSSSKLIEALDKNNIPYTTYEHGNNDDRLVKLNQAVDETNAAFSINVDSEGNKLSEQQISFFENSVIRNDEGKLMPMYHGTQNGGFTVFDAKKARSNGHYGSGFYFSSTPLTAYSSGDVYKVYLNITNPVSQIHPSKTITKAQLTKYVQELADNEEYGIEGYGQSATVKSIVNELAGKDNDFRIFNDVNATCVGDFAQAVKVFNEVNGTNFDGIEVFTETVAFNPEQIKLTTNENPTENQDIRYSVDVPNIDGSVRSVDYLSDVMTINQYSEFKHKIDSDKKYIYERSQNGEYIVPVDNMLIYTDFNKDNIGISGIILFNTDNYDYVSVGTDVVIIGENYHASYAAIKRTCEFYTGKGMVFRYTNEDFGRIRKFDRPTKRNKSRSDQYHSERRAIRTDRNFTTNEKGNIVETKTLVRRNYSLDVDYENAVNSGNTELALSLIRQAAEQAFPDSKARVYDRSIFDDKTAKDGELRTFYHGTNSGEFNEFDIDMLGAGSGDVGWYGKGFYFAFGEGEAKYYGSRVIPAFLNTVNPFYMNDELGTYEGYESRLSDASDATYLINISKLFPELVEGVTVNAVTEDYDVEEISVKELAKKFDDVFRNTEFKVDETEGMYGKEYIVTAGEFEESFTDYDGNVHTYKDFKYNRRFLNKNDAENKLENSWLYFSENVYRDIDIPKIAVFNMEHDISKAVRDRGYDSIYQGKSGDEVVLFKSSQIKRADITYDDNGNLIPLSQRFSDSNDIRYSINVDSDGNTLSEQQIEYFKDSKVRDKNGNLLVMYHGTANSGEFNVFEGNKLSNSTLSSQIGQGFYFTNVEKEARSYTSNVDIYGVKSAGKNPYLFKTYLNITNPFDVNNDSLDMEKAKEVFTRGNNDWFFDNYIPFWLNGKTVDGNKLVKEEIAKMGREEKVSLYVDYFSNSTREVLREMVRAYNYDSQGELLNNIKEVLGFDGIVDEFSDGKYQFVALDSNQIKSVNNLNPTTNDDIRYSIDVGDENFNAAIQEMMDDISGGVDRLANNMSKVMDFKSDISKHMISNVAKNIKKIYGSDIKSKDLEEKLMRMFNYLRETGSINAKDIELIRTSIGEQVVDSMRADDPAAAAEYDKFVSGIKTWDIALDEGQMQEVKNKFDSYYGFKRYMAGKLSLNKNGTLLDNIWTEICELSGGALSYGTRPNNQPIALAEYINKLEPKARILNEQSYEEASMSVALEVFRQFFNETSKKDAAEFMRDEIKEYNKAVKQRYQKLYNEALKEVEKAKAAELERLKQEYEKLTIEEQAAMAEGIGELESVQIQQLKEDAKKRIEELKKQNNEAIARVKADYRNRKLTERANRAWIDTKRKLVNEIESLQNMLAHPKEAATKHVPIHLVLSTIDLLEAIQMETGRNKAITERLAKLASVYESYKTDLNNDDGTNYGFDYDERIAADIEEVKAMFDNGRFYTDLYTPEMERLLEIVRALKTQIKNANNLIIDGQVRDARDVALDAITEVKNSRTESKNYVTDALDRYGNQHLNPYRLMRKLSGYTDGAMMKLYDNLEEGGMREMQIQQQLNDIYKDVLEGSKNQKEIKRFISTKPNDLVDIGIVDETGKSVKVSRAMRMSIIMHSFNENNMRHILYGGLTIPDMKVYSQNKSKAYSEYGDVYRFLNYKEYLQAVKSNDKAKQNKMLADAKKKVDALQDDLSEWEKKFLAAAKKMFHEETGRLINDTSIALKGYTIARVKNYFPIKTDTDFTPTDFAGLVQNGTIEGMGMLKERVTSKKPMMLEDITDVIQRQIRNTSKYAAYAIPVRNFKMAMRQTFKDKRGEGTTLEKNIRKVWNAQNVDNLRNMLTAIETGKGRGEETFKVLNKIRANFAGAVLSINPSVAIKQAASYPTAAAVVGYLPLIQAVKDMPKGFAQAKGIEELEKRNPLLWYRAQGYGSQDLADAKASALINKLPTKLQKALGWTQFMDTGTVRTLEYAAKHYVDNNFKSLEKGSDAYWNKVSEVFTQVVTETQPNYDTLHKATIIRDGDSLAKMLVMFKTQPMQNFGILYDALGELDANINRYNSSKSDANKAKLKESVNKFAYAVTSQLMSAVTFSAMSIIARLALHKIGRYRKGELEEWSWLAVLKEFAEGVVSCLTGMLLGGSEIYETATYYAGKNKYYSGIEVSSVEALNDFTTNTKYLVDATTNLWEAKTTAERDEASQKIAKYSVKVGNYAGQLLGIPTGNIYNIIQSIYLYGVDAVTSVENGKLTFSSKTDVTDWEVATQYERMYDAVVNDDMDEYNKLVSEMINTGKNESNIVGKVKSMIKDDYFSESKDRLETIENLVDIGFSEVEASHTVNQWYTGYDERNEYGPTKTLIRTAADDPSDANRKAVVEEVRNLIELGKTKDNFAKQLKQEFKDEYNEGDNKVNLNAILRQALVAAGYTDEEAAEVLAKWSK